MSNMHNKQLLIAVEQRRIKDVMALVEQGATNLYGAYAVACVKRVDECENYLLKVIKERYQDINKATKKQEQVWIM